MSLPIFHRPALAERFAQRILSEKGASGAFIAAPRRTGKSTFIREDLVPLLKERGAEVIYVDLWSDRTADPADLIVDAIREHLRRHESVVTQWARKGGPERITLGGLQVNIDRIGQGGETIAKALAVLSDETRRLVVMVIDEAQHAQSTPAGQALMFAVKAARDELNGSAHHGFRLVATGSNRDRLAIMVSGKDQAFLHARLVTLPHLDDDYLAWVRDRFEGEARPSMEALREVFAACTHRPEVLADALDELELRPDLDDANVDARLREAVADRQEAARRAFMRLFNALPPLQAAVLQVMAERGADFAPFTQPTYERCAELCAQRTREAVNVNSSTVDYALDALREKGLVWKSGRGQYAVEDSQQAAWLTGRPEEG